MKGCFEISILMAAVRRGDQGPFIPDDRAMFLIPDKAKELLEPVMEPYHQDPDWYFDSVIVGRGPTPWAIACLDREYPIAGHVLTKRPLDGSIRFVPYKRTPAPVPDGYVPAVGTLFLYDKAALEQYADRSPLFLAAWNALKACPEDRRWLVLLDPLPEDWLAEVVPEDQALWRENWKV